MSLGNHLRELATEAEERTRRAFCLPNECVLTDENLHLRVRVLYDIIIQEAKYRASAGVRTMTYMTYNGKDDEKALQTEAAEMLVNRLNQDGICVELEVMGYSLIGDDDEIVDDCICVKLELCW